MSSPNSFRMIQQVPLDTHFTVPPGLKLACISDPDSLDSCVRFPIVSCCQYTYWAYSYIDNRVSMNITLYDPVGNVVKQWEKPGSRYIWQITSDDKSKTITFWGQSNQTITMTWDELGLMKHKASRDDIVSVASYYNLPISDADADALAAALPVFDCSMFSASSFQVQNIAKRDLSSWKIGAVIGGIIGGAIGGIIGGPAGAAAGAALGSQFGAGIGLVAEPSSPPAPYNPDSSEQQTYIYLQRYPVGPFSNGAAFEDIFDWHFPRYGEIEEAGALARPRKGNQVQVWYPVKKQLLSPYSTYPPLPHDVDGKIYKYIFVVIQVLDRSQDGKPAYQMRINPEDFYPDTIAANQRINHSQLSEGGRFAALMGYSTMQVFGAGSLYMVNNQIRGLDSRTGHYYYSLGGKDWEMMDAVKMMLSSLGYDISTIKQGRDLIDWLNQRVY